MQVKLYYNIFVERPVLKQDSGAGEREIKATTVVTAAMLRKTQNCLHLLLGAYPRQDVAAQMSLRN